MMTRSENSIKNIVVGCSNRLVGIFLPFIMRTIIIRYLGEEYLGLNGLYSSILQVLNLAELGFSNAISANLYKPIADGDKNTVVALICFFKKIYRLIGCVIIVAGLIMLLFLDYLINDVPPRGINIYLFFSLYIAQTAFSYFFWAYKSIIIKAHQRSDITEAVGTTVKIFIFIAQYIAIVVYKSIILYVIMNVVCVVMNNVICNYIANKKYDYFEYEATLDDEIRKSIWKEVFALSIHKIGNTLSTSFDTIILSSYMSLSVVAIYGNYNYISSSIAAFIVLIYSSITASVGNSIVSETKEKNYNDFMKISFMNNWVVGWCSICLMCLLQPFMKIWMKNDDSLMLDDITVFAIVICFYIQNIRRVVLMYKDASGIWYTDRIKPLVGCIVNLILNILVVKYYGVIGVVLSTIASYIFVEIPWETKVLVGDFFCVKQRAYYNQIFITAISVVLTCIPTYFLCSLLPDGAAAFVLRVLICLIIPNALMIFLNYRRKEYNNAKMYFRYLFSVLRKRR